MSGTLGPQKIRVRGTLGLQTGSRCMETTIRSDISSPSTSGNNPRLSYIWMYVSWDRYRDTYLDIWVRRVIIIIDTRYGSYIIMIFDIPVMIPVMIPVLIVVMFPVIVFVMCTCYDSYYEPLTIIVMYSSLTIIWFATLILYAWISVA